MNKVIVIGGGSFQGKSLLAMHIASKFKIPIVICTDTIRNILHVLHPNAPYFFTSTYLMTPENLIKQMQEVSNLLKQVLPIYERRGENLIIEGMHLSKEFIAYLAEQSNVLIFCLNNRLPLKERLKYKAITRNRVEYYNPVTRQVKYGKLTPKNIPYTPYIKHANRIQEIHEQIMNWFKESNLPIIDFVNLNEIFKKIENLIEHFL